MGALWMFTFSVLLWGGDAAAGPGRRSTEKVMKVGDVIARKNNKASSVTDSQRTGTLQGLKNKPKDSISPSGQPVNPIGKHIFGKVKHPLRPVTEETEQPTIIDPECLEAHYWHPTMERCQACLPGGGWCIGNSSCCCPGVKQVGSDCKGVPCEDGGERDRCRCTQDSDCIDGSCCGSTGGCGKCATDSEKDGFVVVDNVPGSVVGVKIVWTNPTPRPYRKFCPGEESRLSSRNRSCCESSSDCSKQECCTFNEDRCHGVCKETTCEGKMLSPPDGCPPSASLHTPEPERPLRRKCRKNEECGKHYCCIKNTSRPKAKGWCRQCDVTPSPTMNLVDSSLEFFKKYGFLNCSGEAPCPKEMHCVAGQCEFLSCPFPAPPVVSLQEYEDNCCKNKHCGQGSCCRVLQSKAVAVCYLCHLKGRSYTPYSCQESSNCPTGSCCVELVKGQGKVCSTCAGHAAGLQTRELNGSFDTSSPKRKPNVCRVDSDCAKGKCCIHKKRKKTCRKCPIVQPDSQRLGCAVNEDCPDGHCCSDISNSPGGQGMCKPCVTFGHVIPFTQQTQVTNGPVAKKPPCITDDDCAPVNGTTFCCVSDPFEEGKYCLPHRKKNTICTVGDLPQFSCPCEAGLACLPVAAQETDLMGLGVCSSVDQEDDKEDDVKGSKKKHQADPKKKIAEERRKQREVRKREKATRKVSN